MLTHTEMIFRILVGALLGGVIGYERDVHGRQAGLRTHLIVALASATFMVVSCQFMFYQGYDDSQRAHLEIDASRIAASVVSGVGFLAGGAILKTGLTIQGLTTAAGLWLVTAIGLCAGGGMYWEGTATTILGVIALTFLRILEDRGGAPQKRRVVLAIDSRAYDEKNLLDRFQKLKVGVSDFEYENDLDGKRLTVSFTARVPPDVPLDRLSSVFEKQKGIHRTDILIPK